MAVFGTLHDVKDQLAGDPRLAVAFAYAAEVLREGSPEHRRVLALPQGPASRAELGGGCHVMEQAYLTKPRGEGRWETHRVTIDVQVMIEGEEGMEVAPLEGLAVVDDQTPAKDVVFHAVPPVASWLHARPGSVAVFFPGDAHRPSQSIRGPEPVRKVVVKVPTGRP